MEKKPPKKFIEQSILLVPPANSIQPVMPKPGFRGIPVNLGFSLPTGKYPAECYILLDGLDKPTRICGNDQWQALFLAIEGMRRRLLAFKQLGWTVEMVDDGDEFEGGGPGVEVSFESLMPCSKFSAD
jgi:hypothetical protein